MRYVLEAILLALYSVLVVTVTRRTFTDEECGRQVSLWSPLNEAIEYVEYDFENDFDQPSIYRGPPTLELEAAWDALWRFDPVPFPIDKLPLVNRSDEALAGRVLASTEKGTVAATFDGFHQIHCLNMIRQYTWRDWYFQHEDVVPPPLDMLASDVGTRIHVDHCIETLRKSIMCHGDTTPYFTVFDSEQSLGARADFSAHHKCRNFEKLRQWTRDNAKALDLSKEKVHEYHGSDDHWR
ncbi:hypothetical protein GGR57DRAFT_459069 [Xylariaceae sp. FL1272]|nr:hypothetical protein GGR57DRAFT_459069 [Xylariaceae sp. FL1272]